MSREEYFCDKIVKKCRKVITIKKSGGKRKSGELLLLRGEVGAVNESGHTRFLGGDVIITHSAREEEVWL